MKLHAASGKTIYSAWRAVRRFHARIPSITLVPVMLAACDTPLVPELPAEDVYEYRLATNPPETLRWSVGASVRVHVVESADAPLLRTALTHAAAAWNQHALVDEYRIVPTRTSADADVLLAWSSAVLPVETTLCAPSGGRAQTTFCLDGQRLFAYPLPDGSNSSVRMLVTVGTVLANAPAALDAVVAHELGHVLGIARHSEVATDLMFTDPTVATPSPRDVATVRMLYRSRADVVP